MFSGNSNTALIGWKYNPEWERTYPWCVKYEEPPNPNPSPALSSLSLSEIRSRIRSSESEKFFERAFCKMCKVVLYPDARSLFVHQNSSAHMSKLPKSQAQEQNQAAAIYSRTESGHFRRLLAWCVAPGCYAEHRRGMSPCTLHTFPPDGETRQKWIAFVQQKDPSWNLPVQKGHYYALCNEHFEDDAFENLIRFKLGFARKLVLKQGAVPSIHKEPQSGFCNRGHSLLKETHKKEKDAKTSKKTKETSKEKGAKPSKKKKRHKIENQPYVEIETADPGLENDLDFIPLLEGSEKPERKPIKEELDLSIQDSIDSEKPAPSECIKWGGLDEVLLTTHKIENDNSLGSSRLDECQSSVSMPEVCTTTTTSDLFSEMKPFPLSFIGNNSSLPVTSFTTEDHGGISCLNTSHASAIENTSAAVNSLTSTTSSLRSAAFLGSESSNLPGNSVASHQQQPCFGASTALTSSELAMGSLPGISSVSPSTSSLAVKEVFPSKDGLVILCMANKGGQSRATLVPSTRAKPRPRLKSTTRAPLNIAASAPAILASTTAFISVSSPSSKPHPIALTKVNSGPSVKNFGNIQMLAPPTQMMLASIEVNNRPSGDQTAALKNQESHKLIVLKTAPVVPLTGNAPLDHSTAPDLMTGTDSDICSSDAMKYLTVSHQLASLASDSKMKQVQQTVLEPVVKMRRLSDTVQHILAERAFITISQLKQYSEEVSDVQNVIACSKESTEDSAVTYSREGTSQDMKGGLVENIKQNKAVVSENTQYGSSTNQKHSGNQEQLDSTKELSQIASDTQNGVVNVRIVDKLEPGWKLLTLNDISMLADKRKGGKNILTSTCKETDNLTVEWENNTQNGMKEMEIQRGNFEVLESDNSMSRTIRVTYEEDKSDCEMEMIVEEVEENTDMEKQRLAMKSETGVDSCSYQGGAKRKRSKPKQKSFAELPADILHHEALFVAVVKQILRMFFMTPKDLVLKIDFSGGSSKRQNYDLEITEHMLASPTALTKELSNIRLFLIIGRRNAAINFIFP